MHTNRDDNDHIPTTIVGWCQGIKPGQHKIDVYISRNGGNSDCYTGWSNQDYMEVWEPTKHEQAMISYSQRMNTDNGHDGGNVLTFNFKKKSQTSTMRLLYYDNLRVIGHGKWCRWEMRVNHKSCKAPIAGSLYTYNHDNDHYPHMLIGECPGWGKGNLRIDIHITRNGGADCYTGWSPGPKVMHALIEVQETCGKLVGCSVMESCQIGKTNKCKICRPHYKLSKDKLKCTMSVGEASKIAAFRLTKKSTNQGGDNYNVIPGRTLNFVKGSSNSVMKLTYADNLRTHGNGKICYWRIRVDGKNCPIDIYNSKYTARSSDNDHTPHAIIGTCAKISAGSHVMSIYLWRNGGADCYTGWSGSGDRDAYFMEAEEINPKGQFTHKMFSVGNDGRDTGIVNGVNMHFDKRSDNTHLRITWSTNLRTRAHNNRGGVICHWELQIDGKSCVKPTKIGASMHSQRDDNDHIAVTIVGWCQNIKKGPHSLSVYVSRNQGNADCYTGHANNDYMEVWEPTKDEQKMLYYSQRMNTDNGVDQTTSYLDYTFAKKSEKSVMRFMFYDNLRVIGHGKWCRWEMKVDDKSCPAPIAGSLYTYQHDNDHYPHIFMGECPGLKKGKRKIKIAITRNSGADCYSGWSPGPKVQHTLIEAQEGCANIIGCAVRGSCDIGKEQCMKCRSGYLLIHGTIDTCKMPPGKPAKFPAARLTAKNDNYGGDQVDEIPMRKLVFTKRSDKTLMKLTYADNFRVHGSGKACYWRIRIDGRNCPIDIYNGKHSGHSSDNDYTPHAIIGTCSKLSAGAHTMTIQLWRGGGSDCYTGWSASGARDAFYMEAEEINPNGQFTSRMFTVGDDGRDGGTVNGVNLGFDKRVDNSQLRITWSTNLRIRAHNQKGGVYCNWELRIDGRSCEAPTKIGASLHSQNNDNDHQPVSIVGWCTNIKRGPHILTAYVSRNSGNADCYTGWSNQDYMEVWEPTPQEQALISYQQKTRTDQGSDYSDSVLSFKFKKKKPKENWVMRILYYDNLRVIGGGKWCRWEVLVDSSPCPVPIAGSVHTNSGDNDHYPATMMGECAGFDPGELTIDVAVTSSSGADCYTGWTPSPHIMHSLLEVQESPTIWTIVFQEEEGSGNGAKFDNHPLRTLSLNKPPFDLKLGNYRVRMEWGEEGAFAEFTVPPGQNIFSQKKEQLFIPVKHIVTSSLDNNLKLGSTANFCHACVKGGTKYGDTCWGLIPKKSSHRLCGCNSGGWEGYGIYYGGYKKNNDGCGGQGGGFAGPKKNNQQKGNLDSVGLRIKIHSL